ncbi:MAG: peptide chain release factor N(5)-glutamine methyltransferase [Firmicutes bacterium]|nr:peptide chain release factor N(5)-glutamine methyltransferase [Bacillota bacterium]
MSLAVKEILNIGCRQLEECGIADAAIDSKLLYCHLMNVTTTQLILEYQKILPDALCDEYFKLLDIRGSGVPLQHITGIQEFMGLEFAVNEHVLIPRQDTETLVEDALDVINQNVLRGEALSIKPKKDYDVLDLCCGSGAIGVSLAALCPKVKVTCSDLSKDAISVARQNASKLAGGKKISFEEGNLLMPFKGRFKNKKFDMIISNPPYIKTSVIPTLQKEVRDHEPMMALDGGASGLDCYRQIIADAADCLKKEGVLMFEIGHDQKEEVCALLEETGRFENITGLQDLAHRDRIVFATLAPKKK